MKKNVSVEEFKVSTIKLGYAIDAPLTRVWQAFTDDIKKWWRKDFFGNSASREMVLELYPGGRLFEKGDANTGILWYHIVSVDDFKSINFAGYLFPSFGGPSNSYLTLDFQADGKKTILKVTDIQFGAFNRETPGFIEDGWNRIFGVAFREYVENIRID